MRINSQGKNLNQADFILTLMSAFWDEGRAALERWSRDSRVPGDPAYNAYLSPEPDRLRRVAVALGFRRGRLEDAYTVLRGRDRATGKVSPALRQAQFDRLASAQARVLDKDAWKEFLQCLLRAGHRSAATISSNLAVVYAYALYLIGKHDYRLPLKQLREVIARWFFMSSLTGRYSFSPETTIASDLASLPAGNEPDGFVRRLDEMIAQRLTNDYWEITLPSELATSASRSPSLFGYLAALNILDAPVLFSKMRCAELFDPALTGGRVKVERHHLFPRKYLEGIGITETRGVNQIANLAILEWHDNLAISAADPAVYWPGYLEAMRNPPAGMARFAVAEIESMVRLHALPDGWHAMAYDEFLVERRRRMAAVIREAFERLVRGDEQELAPSWPPSPAGVEHLLHEGETSGLELKSSLRADTLGRDIPPKVLEKVVARTVAGFLNAHGGLLVMGADDHGTPLGLERDLATLNRTDLDGFQQALVQVLATYLGADVAASVRIHLTKVGPDGRDVALVDCPPHGRPVYLLDGGQKRVPRSSGKHHASHGRGGGSFLRLATLEEPGLSSTQPGLRGWVRPRSEAASVRSRAVDNSRPERDAVTMRVHQVVYRDGRWDGKTPEEWVPEVVEAIVRAFDPLQVILFGSIARGDGGPDSDIDLLVVLPHVEHRVEAAMTMRDAIADLPPPIDLVPTDAAEIARRRGSPASVIHTALGEGKIVYERAA